MGTVARAFVVMALVSIAARARAQTPPERSVPIVGAIDVRSSDPCLDVVAIAAQITRWLHRDAIDARVGVLLRTAPEGGERIEVIRDGSVVAERLFDGGEASCTEKQAALGLMIAMALDATLVEDLAPVPVPVPVIAAPEPVPERVLALELAGDFGVGLLPRASGGASLSGELVLRDRFAFRLGLFGQATADASLDRGRVSTSLLGARADACLGITASRFHLEGCAGFGAGFVIAEGHGFTADSRAIVPWAAASVGVAGRMRLSEKLALRLGLDALIPVVRPVLVVTDVAGAVVGRQSLSPVALHASIGVVVSFR